MTLLKYVILLIIYLLIISCGGGGGGSPASQPPTVEAQPPVVNAGIDQTADKGGLITLAGSGSDANGSVTFNWSQTSGTAVTLSSTTISNPTFMAPMVTSSLQLSFSLTVTDTAGNSVVDTVTITIVDSNTSPDVDAGPDQIVDEGEVVFLAGSGSDAEGPVTLSWSQISGTTVTLSDNTIANPTFTAPLVSIDETLIFRLTVTDNIGATVFDDVSIMTDDNNSPPPSASLSYLFYSNSLNAVNPATPATPTLIEPTSKLVQKSAGLSATAEKIQWGELDTTTRIVTDWRTHAVIYPSTDGKIYQVSGLLTGNLTPIQVSNETQAEKICTSVIGGTAVRHDFDNVENSTYLYVLPGADSVCDTNDDVWKIVRLGMNLNDAPIIAKKFVSELTNPINGAISGWLVHDSGELQACDANFANCTALIIVTDSVDWRLNSTLENILLDIDGKLHIYSTTTKTLSPARFSIPIGTHNSVADSDGTTIYFANDNTLYQMPADGSADATVLHTEIDNIWRVVAGNNNVVYQQSVNGIGVEIKSIPKSGGTPISLAMAGVDNDILLLYVQDGKVYFNERILSALPLFTITPLIAGVINEDGSGLTETADGVWFGGKLKTTFNLDLGFRASELLEKIFLLQGFDIAGTSGGFAGASISVFDATTAAVGITLGNLPDTDKILDFQCFGFGDNALCSTLIEIDIIPAPTIPIQNDVFFINSSTPDSLLRITDTIDESEAVLF